MAVREVQLFDDSVQTRTISPDVVIPADIDETAAFNFSSASGTWAGRATGVINSTNTTSTIGNLRASLQIAGLSIAIPIGSTNTAAAWNYGATGGTFSGTPIVTFSERTSALTTGTAEYPSITALSTSSITISVRLAQTAGTMNAIGIYGY